MERRLLLTFALTFLVILLFQPILKKYFPQTPTAPTQRQTQAQTQNSEPVSQPAPAAIAQSHNETAVSIPAKQATAESTIVVDNDLYRITFTNRGAQVKSWILKKFNDDKGQPLELINHAAADRYGYPLSLWT